MRLRTRVRQDRPADAGTLLSVLWFIRMLRRCDLRVRFGHA